MHFASYYRWLVIRDWIHVSPTDRVLDVGCDDGEIIARIRAAVKLGIDLNPYSPAPSVCLIRGDACRLPLLSEKFDTVFAFDIIEHIEDDRAVLAELVRVLARDGTLWLSAPAVGFGLFPPFITARANRGGDTFATAIQLKRPGTNCLPTHRSRFCLGTSRYSASFTLVCAS